MTSVKKSTKGLKKPKKLADLSMGKLSAKSASQVRGGRFDESPKEKK